MTKKEKELALIMREVGAYTHHGDFNMGYSYEFQPDQLVRFAELLEAKVRADEREACAHIVEDWDSDLACPREVADAIRARGEK